MKALRTAAGIIGTLLAIQPLAAWALESERSDFEGNESKCEVEVLTMSKGSNKSKSPQSGTLVAKEGNPICGGGA